MSEEKINMSMIKYMVIEVTLAQKKVYFKSLNKER